MPQPIFRDIKCDLRKRSIKRKQFLMTLGERIPASLTFQAAHFFRGRL